MSAISASPVTRGRPHQKPNPTKTATKIGASAVPRPSSAFSTSIDESTFSAWNAAVKVFSAGTVNPKPTPRLAVATSSSPYATPWSLSTAALTTRSVIASRFASSPTRYTRRVPTRAAQRAPEQRRRNRGDRLRDEHRAVRSTRESVLGRAREDRARGGERDERDALHDGRDVDNEDFADAMPL